MRSDLWESLRTILFRGRDCSCRQLSWHDPSITARWDIGHHYRSTGWRSPHWAIIVREQLNHIFNDRWCGRDGPIPWPPNSPDLAPPDFFVWGYVKSTVYAKRPQNLVDLRREIERPFSKSLQKWCVPRGAIWIWGLICTACAMVDMLSANVLRNKLQILLHLYVPLTSNKFA